MDLYGTHFPVLAAAVAKTTGPVLELGMGEFSTPMLHYMCEGERRYLLSVDANREWVDKYRAYEGKHHSIQLERDWAEAVAYALDQCDAYSVIFVDFAPGEMRAPVIERLKDKGHFIVAHDTEECDRDKYPSGANYGYEPVFKLFTYRQDFKRWRPYSTIVSMFAPFYIAEGDREWQPPESPKA